MQSAMQLSNMRAIV